MKKRKISFFIIYLCSLLAVCLLFYVYGFQAINPQINSLDLKHQANVAQITRNNESLKNLSSMKAATAKLAAKLAQGSKATSISGTAVEFDVNSGLKSAGITKLQSFAITEAATSTSTIKASDGKALYSIPITLSLKCTSQQLSTLLNYFEKSTVGAYYVNKVSYTNGQTNDSLLSVSLSMSIYYFSAQTASSSGGK